MAKILPNVRQRVTGRTNGIIPKTKGEFPFIPLFADLLWDETFLSLRYSSALLYIFMLCEAGKKDTFTFTTKTAKEKYGMNQVTYYTARNELLEKEFITCIERNPHRKMPNVYGFSTNWKIYHRK